MYEMNMTMTLAHVVHCISGLQSVPTAGRERHTYDMTRHGLTLSEVIAISDRQRHYKKQELVYSLHNAVYVLITFNFK